MNKITEHEWYCETNSICSFTIEVTPFPADGDSRDEDTILLAVDDNQYAYHNNSVEFEINKPDAVAIAEHFNLESEYKKAFLAAKAFIDSHAADPDLTNEMCEKYSKYLEAIKDGLQ